MSINEWMNKEEVAYIFEGILLNQEKEGDPAICYNVDGPWGNYAKWNKSDRERQILYDLTYVWNVKYWISLKQRVEWWFPGPVGRGKWGGDS